MNMRTGLRRQGRILVAALLLCTVSSLALAGVGEPAKSTSDRPCQATATTKPQHEVRSVGKASIPIKFVSPARFKARIGEVVMVSLTVLATEDIAQLQAQVTTEKTLNLAGTVNDTRINAIAAGNQVTLNFAVQPQADGLSYVNVIITTHSGQGKRMASYSIPVEVGDTRAAVVSKGAPNLVVDEDGVVLEVMPALDGSPARQPR